MALKLLERSDVSKSSTTGSPSREGNSQVFSNPGRWLGEIDFSGLGNLQMTSKVKGVSGDIEIGILIGEGGTFFVASCRPHCVGSGDSFENALTDWFEQLTYTRNRVRELHPPYAPATENNIGKLVEFFGAL